MANRAALASTILALYASAETLLEVIRRAGYDAVLPHAGAVGSQAWGAGEAHAAAKAVATLLGGAVAMVLSMPLGAEMGPVDRLLMQALPSLYLLPHDALRRTLLVLTAVLMVWTGGGIYAAAARALRHGSTNMNTLVSLGTGVAFGYSVYATIAPAPGREVHFDAVLLILGFLLLGKVLETRAKRRALAAINALSRLQPSTARRIVGSGRTLVPLKELRVGDRILVLPGERFPVDAS